MTASVLARLLLRYVAGAIVAKGIFDPAMGDMLINDPEIAQAVEIALGLLLSGVSEGWYALARRFGWSR